MKQACRWAIFFTVLATTLKLFWLGYDLTPVLPDSSWYQNVIYGIRQKGFIDGHNPAFPPLYIWITVLVNSTGLTLLKSFQMVSVVSGILFTGVFVLFANELLNGKKISVIFSGVLILLQPLLNYFHRKALAESLFFLLFTAFAYLLLRAYRSQKSKLYVYSGILAALCGITRYEGVVIQAMVTLCLFVYMLADKLPLKNAVRKCCLFIFPTVLLLNGFSMLSFYKAGVYTPYTTFYRYRDMPKWGSEDYVIRGGRSTIRTVVLNEADVPRSLEVYAAEVKMKYIKGIRLYGQSQPEEIRLDLLHFIKEKYSNVRWLLTERLPLVFSPWLMLFAGAGLFVLIRDPGTRKQNIIFLVTVTGLILFYALVEMRAQRYFVFMLIPVMAWVSQGAVQIFNAFRGKSRLSRCAALLPLLILPAVYLVNVTEPIRAAGKKPPAGSEWQTELFYREAGLLLREFCDKKGIKHPKIANPREAGVYAEGIAYGLPEGAPGDIRFLKVFIHENQIQFAFITSKKKLDIFLKTGAIILSDVNKKEWPFKIVYWPENL